MYSLLSKKFRLVKKFAEHIGYRRKPKLVKKWADLTMKILSATLGCVSAHVSSPWLRGDGDMQILFAIVSQPRLGLWRNLQTSDAAVKEILNIL